MLPMALCADARLDGENLIGDPTEGALIVLAEKGGISVEGAREMLSARGRSAVRLGLQVHGHLPQHDRSSGQTGGALLRQGRAGCADRTQPARTGCREARCCRSPTRTASWRSKENERMAAAGERVMVVARRDFDPQTFDPKGKLIDLMKDLTLLAMVGIVDPPRTEAKDAIAKCHSAGIQVRMITGDHAVTAAAIGHELGIEGTALTGAQFAAMSDDELIKELDNIGVVARVAPEDKIRLVDLLQRKQNIVAMTGDGVNDAPALKKADIGVAMGITGTEVSKGAAVMILTDDNFATIVKAVEYGRAIYDNLAKYIRFQMGMLSAFIISYLGATIFGILGGVPFSTLIVLWINFLVQVPIAMALGFDKPSPGLMERKPRPLSQPVLSRSQWVRLVFTGLLIAIGTLVMEAVYDASRHSCRGNHGVRGLLVVQHRPGPQRSFRNRHGVQPGQPVRPAPVAALRAGAVVHLTTGRVWHRGPHPGDNPDQRPTMAGLHRVRPCHGADRRSDQVLHAQTQRIISVVFGQLSLPKHHNNKS